MNYFGYQTAAKRYAVGRPYFHPIVGDIIKRHISTPVSKALDVGCGTGLSSRMLVDLAESVMAVDRSAEMLAEAYKSSRISYQTSPAEELPFGDSQFDLITAGLAFHWFDRTRFLPEANRVLRESGSLVVYNHWFAGEMAGNAEFRNWNTAYLNRYPPPKRDSNPLADDEAKSAGFEVVARENFSNFWPFSVEELASYLITQSNVIARVEAGDERSESVSEWITQTVEPNFSRRREAFVFGGEVFILRSRRKPNQ